MRRVTPPSSHTTARPSVCSMRRSWLISTIPEREDASSFSSHSMAGRSRWFVGSSSSSRSGCGAMARARAQRRASPPERCAGSSNPVMPRRSSRAWQRCRSSPGAHAGLHVFQRGGEAGHVRLLRQVAHGGAGLDEARAAIGFHQPGGDLQQRRFAGAVAPRRGQMRSPAPTPISAPSSSGWVPRVARMSWRCSRGGAMGAVSPGSATARKAFRRFGRGPGRAAADNRPSGCPAGGLTFTARPLDCAY